MEVKEIIIIWLLLVGAVSLVFLIWKQTNSGKKTCSKCGTRYEGERCPRCNGYCFKCKDWYEGDHCPKCTKYCPKCRNWYKGVFCPQCGGPVPERDIGYKTENEEYAAAHHLWICAYCETLNEGGETVKSSGLHGRGVKMSASKPCICCGKSGAKILEKGSVVCSNIDETSLCIYIDKSNVPHLSYEVDVICCGSKFGMYKALVDVKSTEVLLTESQIYYDAYVIGSLFGQNYLFHNVEYSSENDIAKLYDQTRNITATELNPASFVETIKLLWEKGKQSNKIILPTDEKFVDSSAISWVSSEKPRGEAVDAYVHTQIAYDYFDTEMNHKPNINGNPIPIQVITGFEYLFEESEYKNFINNAFHVTTEQNGELTLFLAFGKGSFGKDCISGNLDVVAHEYMHSVESCYSNMVYKGESGALMEALSDIFGEIVEYWYYSSQNPLYEMNWIHNQRSIADPDGSNKENDRYPVKYNGTYW